MRWQVALLMSWGAVVGVAGVARAEGGSDRLAAYQDEAVGVRIIAPLGRDGSTADRGGTVSWDAFQGRDHHPIDEETFFRVVGREDLVRRFHHRAVLKKSLMAGGGVAIAGGALYALVTLLSNQGPTVLPPCPSSATSCGISPSHGPSPAWGLIGVGSGLASVLVGHLLNPSPIGAPEADRLARDHDEQLKAAFGLSDVAGR